MTQQQEVDELFAEVGDYKHGSIRRIRLTNFLTYAHVEFSPGPRLNMVVGPNGTGKSTILCAICLGLGGEPRLLGRASDIETFVMNGEDEGCIEIELENAANRQNPIIQRIIRRQGSPKSSFLLNGTTTTAKAVKQTCLQDYNITVDNLCTFLPQDRVGSFSGFDSKQLLLETEKSLSASQHLYNTHQELIKDQQELRGGNNQVETLREKLGQLQVENQRLEREKQRMEEREAALKEADLLRKKLLWLKFEEARDVTLEKRESRNKLKDKAKEVAATVQPLEEKYNSAKEELEAVSTAFQQLEQEIRHHKGDMEKQAKKYESHDDAIETTLQELHAMDSHRAMLEQRAQQQREKVDDIQRHLEQFEALETLQQQEHQARMEHKAHLPQYETAKQERNSVKEEMDELDRNRRHLQTKLGRLQDKRTQHREKIFRMQPNLKAIHDWISQNRQLFRKEVIGPIVCEIATTSAKSASFLEQHIPNSTLRSFVVQEKSDYDVLYKRVREELKVPINIIMSKVEPPKPRFYSDTKMKVLKQRHGVVGFMDETFNAPPLVVQALRETANLDRVLVGTDKTQASLDNENLLDYLAEPEDGSSRLRSCVIFSTDGNKSFKYSSIISEYSKKASLRVDDVRDARWLAPSDPDSDRKKEMVKKELEDLTARHDALRPKLQEAEQRIPELEGAVQRASARLLDAKKNLQNLTSIVKKLRHAEGRLKDAEQALAVNNEEEKKQKIDVLNNRIRHSLSALDAQAESYRKMMVATVKCAGVRLNRDVVKNEERRLGEEFERARREFEKAKAEYKKASEAYGKAKADMEVLRAQADQEAAIVDADGNELPLKAELEAIACETVPDAQAVLEEAEQHADSIIADPNVVRQYEARKQEMEQVQAELDNLTTSKERRIEELKQKLQPWEDALSNSVSKIDALFSGYMREVGCTGEVVLAKGTPPENNDDEEDHLGGYGNFKDWGIEIRVSFRDGVKPQVLSARVQSGGERSVSTIMYLMALQDLMVAPFRCVDEINQGLDDRNERLVFRRIVENSTKIPGPQGPAHHSGQYFLITPKLLPNLYDMEVEAITVLFIFNGAHAFKSPSDWDVSRLLEVRKRCHDDAGVATDGADENDPNNRPGEETQPRAKAARTQS